MSVQVLTQINAHNPGHDLWILPLNSRNSSALRVDWLMNFQRARAETYTPERIDSELAELLKETDLPFYENRTPETPLMIAPRSSLSARWIVYFDFADMTPELSRQVEQVWISLGKPSLRIFLPESVTSQEFQRKWNQLSQIKDYSLVSE
ncbi:MAG: hypothetical protein ACK5RO_01680 [Pseudobdellovibrionaceae bacterium]|jgi:hypothetical protein